MFSGITQTTGKIKKIEKKDQLTQLFIECPSFTQEKKIGDSIAVDGACLTITQKDATGFWFDAIQETLEKTIIGAYQIDTIVNLEESLRIGQTLDGHFVAGHVDFTTPLLERIETPNNVTLKFKLPLPYAKYFALKGSVTINGVSLTISHLLQESFEVSIIPHTLEHTNLGKLQPNNKVNIEVDLLCRYLESLMKEKEETISYKYLSDRGFL